LHCSSQGKQLAALDSAGLTNHNVSLSANGRWVAAATFTTDVKIHEILYDKAGAFSKTRKVMDLKVIGAVMQNIISQ
jgi:transducin beta-like protein 2